MFPKSREKVNMSRYVDKPDVGISRQGLLRQFYECVELFTRKNGQSRWRDQEFQGRNTDAKTRTNGSCNIKTHFIGWD